LGVAAPAEVRQGQPRIGGRVAAHLENEEEGAEKRRQNVIRERDRENKRERKSNDPEAQGSGAGSSMRVGHKCT